jgi:hypothetical protein
MSGVRLCREYLPGMKKRNWGRIVFISSESAVQIPAEMIHYGMTKTAQLAISPRLGGNHRGYGRYREYRAGWADRFRRRECICRSSGGSFAQDKGGIRDGVLSQRAPQFLVTALRASGRSGSLGGVPLQSTLLGHERRCPQSRWRCCALDSLSGQLTNPAH